MTTVPSKKQCNAEIECLDISYYLTIRVSYALKRGMFQMRLNDVVLRRTEHCQYTEGAVQPVLLRIVWDIVYLYTCRISRCIVCVVICIVCIVVVVCIVVSCTVCIVSCTLCIVSCVYC